MPIHETRTIEPTHCRASIKTKLLATCERAFNANIMPLKESMVRWIVFKRHGKSEQTNFIHKLNKHVIIWTYVKHENLEA
jgi:hypothetical protein